MSQELSLVPQYITLRGNKTLENIFCVLLGAFLLSLLAQISIPLSWTPVPITGQTFGVSLLALTWGRKRGLAAMVCYLCAGAIGFPVFAAGASGISFGPTLGYMVGMVFATWWVGWLSDSGWTKTFLRTYLATVSGSVIIFSCGAVVLSFFLPAKDLLVAGILSFLPGDFLKSMLASLITFRFQGSRS